MGSYISIPILALAAIVQATFMPQIRILGGMPDLVFLLVLAWAINGPLESAVAWSFAGGICQDLLSAAPVGTSALGMIFLVFAIHFVRQQVYRITFILIIGLVLVGTFFQQIVVMIILAVTGFPPHILDSLGYIVLPTMLYNLVFIWPVYWFIRWLQRQILRERPTFSSR
jgi:rod shape-determining protein MreD